MRNVRLIFFEAENVFFNIQKNPINQRACINRLKLVVK